MFGNSLKHLKMWLKVITSLGGLVVTSLMLFMHLYNKYRLLFGSSDHLHFLACQIFERSCPHNPSRVNALFWLGVNHIPRFTKWEEDQYEKQTTLLIYNFPVKSSEPF